MFLIVQNEQIQDSPDLIACYLTGKYGENGKPKRLRSTDAEIKKGLDLGNGKRLPKDSYIRCGHLCTVQISEIDTYAGSIPPAQMILVGKILHELLDIDREIRQLMKKGLKKK